MLVYSRSVGVGDTGMGVFFFFFQAEDGIRDVAVTGVQTCALPISPSSSDLILLATLAAPPGTNVLLFAQTTGTGASGDILSTLPKTYSSKIMSPTTKTFALPNLWIMFFRFFIFSLLCLGPIKEA